MTVGVAVLGSTGSIGCSTLQVLARQRDRFRVVALTGYSNKDLLTRQAAEWNPSYVGLVNGGTAGEGSAYCARPMVHEGTLPVGDLPFQA